MRRDITVAAQARTERGKNESRRLRRRGMIPAILYGAYQDAVAVAVDPKEMQGILHSKTGHNTIFNVAIDGGTTPAMVVDWQYDPVKDTLLHIDLKRIDLSKRVRVSVPVVTHGDPKGVKIQGGLLELVTREVDVECLPDDIPEKFDLDVAELMVGQSVRASDIAMPAEVTLVSSPENVIAHVVTIRVVEEAAPAAAAAPEAAPAPGAAAAAEPEVIKKGKKEEEAPAEEGKGKKK